MFCSELRFDCCNSIQASWSCVEEVTYLCLIEKDLLYLDFGMALGLPLSCN